MNVIVATDVLGWGTAVLLVAALGGAAARLRGLGAMPEGMINLAWTRGWPWLDAAVAIVAFMHGSVPMRARIAQHADRVGLYLASTALLLAFAQIVLGWLARDPGRQHAWAGRARLLNLFLIAALAAGHVLLNAGNLEALLS
jgi:hypothetical protein